MERKITLELVDKNHYWMKGIYLIRIGRLMYVGKTVCVGQRAYEHQIGINRAISNYSNWTNYGFADTDKAKSNKGYMKVAKYLLENPKVESGTVEVLQRQVCSNMLYFAEDFFLKEICNNPDCYNSATYSTRPSSTSDNLWDSEIIGDGIEYFDPRIKHLRVLSTKDKNYNKEIIKQINKVKESRQYKMQRIGEERIRLLGDNPSLERRSVVIRYIANKILNISS